MSAALVVSLECYDFQIEGQPCVLRFPSEVEAEEWAFAKLVEIGEMAVNPDGSIWTGDRQQQFRDKSEALAEWQFNLGASEYFHVYECRDIVPCQSA